MDHPPIFNDNLAGALCGLRDTAEILEAVKTLERRQAAHGSAHVVEAWIRAAKASVVVRAVWSEECLLQAVGRGDISQYVILGAGMDSFAYRRPDLASRLRVFEVDHPDTQAFKQTRLREIGTEIPPHLTYVPLDFESASLLEILERRGYRRDMPAYFSLLGVAIYLSSDGVGRMLRDIAAAAAGSEVVLNYVVPPHLLNEEEREVQRLLESWISQSGEPHRSYFEPAQIEALLYELGFSEVSQLRAEEATARYLPGRSDGLRVSGLTTLLQAKV